MTEYQVRGALVTALENGNSREEVADRLGLAYDELMERHGLHVKNAGKLASFKHPAGEPNVVELDQD